MVWNIPTKQPSDDDYRDVLLCMLNSMLLLFITVKFNNSTSTMHNTYFRNAIYDIENSSDNLHQIGKKRRQIVEQVWSLKMRFDFEIKNKLEMEKKLQLAHQLQL